MVLCHRRSKRYAQLDKSHESLRPLHRPAFRRPVQVDELHEYVSSVLFEHADQLHTPVLLLPVRNGNGTIDGKHLATPLVQLCG